MAITLAEAQLATQDAIIAGVIEKFRKSSFLLDAMPFDQVVNPAGGGGTLTYAYLIEKTESSAATRAVNAEYTPASATKEKLSADLAILGGSFEIDRVLSGTIAGEGLYSEIDWQIEQKVKAARALFHNLAINGDTGGNADEFDGLDVLVTGSSTEAGTAAAIDLSSMSNIDSNYKAFLYAFDKWLSSMDEMPSALMMNGTMLSVMRTIARLAGYQSAAEDAFGRPVQTYNGIPLVDLGARPGTSNPVVATKTRTIGQAETTGLTDIYAARIGMDGFHGVAPAVGDLVRTWLPDFTTAGAVKKGEVEMVAAVVLKRTTAAGVLRNLKVA